MVALSVMAVVAVIVFAAAFLLRPWACARNCESNVP